MPFKIVFDNASRDANRLSVLDREVITSCAMRAQLPFVVVTSTARTPDEQAHAMFRNCVENGPDSQLALYGQWGDLVVQVFIDQAAKGITAEATVVDAMARMIRQIGPEKVSHHCADWSKLHVIDLSVQRMRAASRPLFESAIASDPRVVRHFSPYTVTHPDPCFHLEINQSA